VDSLSLSLSLSLNQKFERALEFKKKKKAEQQGSKALDDTSRGAGKTIGSTETDGGGEGKQNKKPAKALTKPSVPLALLDGAGKLIDQSKGKKCKSPGFTDCCVGEIVLSGQATRYLCGIDDENSPAAPKKQTQVAAMSNDRKVDLVFDPEAMLDSDDPGYSGGHWRINSELFQ